MLRKKPLQGRKGNFHRRSGSKQHAAIQPGPSATGYLALEELKEHAGVLGGAVEDQPPIAPICFFLGI